ncbi:MAG: ATPase domain-containing protein, partial [Pseudomonadota bacterium]
MVPTASKQTRLSTGVKALDDVMQGGLPEGGAYFVMGGPGSGKTTLCLQFLAAGEKSNLLISFGEQESQIRNNAPEDMDVSAIQILDLSPSASSFSPEENYDVVEVAEMEGKPIMETIRKRVESDAPSRVVIDSMSHLQYLAQDQYHFRHLALGLLHFLKGQGATVVFTSEAEASSENGNLAFLSDGIIELDSWYESRQISLPKLRGSDVAPGPHTYRLTGHGLKVAPRLQARDHTRSFSAKMLGSGISALDELAGGGIHKGSTNLISGPSGVGKSSMGMVYLKEQAAQGVRSAVINMEESRDLILQRCRSTGIAVDDLIDDDLLTIHSIEALTYSADELAALIRDEVERRDVRVLLIDSIGSLRLSIKAGEELVQRLHEICRYLANMGVTTFLIEETKKISGQTQSTAEQIGYLTDNIILLRYIDHDGGLGRALGFLKKRTGNFSPYPRRFSISSEGVQ